MGFSWFLLFWAQGPFFEICTTRKFLLVGSFGHRDRFSRFVLLENFFCSPLLGTEDDFNNLESFVS